MKLVFADPKCPSPYNSETSRTKGLGGTEATVVRIAAGLSRHHDVTVIQRGRDQSLEESPTLRFLPESQMLPCAASADHIVFVQRAQGLAHIAGKTKGRFWVWLHNFLEDEVPFFWQDHLRVRLGMICVSSSHARHTRAAIGRHWATRVSLGWAARGGVCFQYNPLNELLVNAPRHLRDPNKLVFFSSPHKGLDQVLEVFGKLRTQHPAIQLFVANPGYLQAKNPALLQQAGVQVLGTLSAQQVAEHVSSAGFVLYPQTKRPETFGLVFAEAHALGTPVLAHDFGAAREILGPSNPPIDATNMDAVLQLADQWLRGARPDVCASDRFNLEPVLAGWESFLADPNGFIKKQESLTA